MSTQLYEIKERPMNELGRTPKAVLELLSDEPRTVRQCADELEVATSAIQTALNRLEAFGYATHTATPAGRRGRTYKITPKGQRAYMDDDSDALNRVLETLDTKVAARGEHELAALDATAEITRLAAEARRHGASMPELAKRIKRLDKRDRVMLSISRQALDAMLAKLDGNAQPPAARKPRASRRRREAGPAGSLNAAAFE
jgi:predicted ArsR family transcriptional regulator